jgi:hypothetical protein
MWRQDGTRVLTAEDARLWLDEIGFCSFLPTGGPLASLTQATAGSAEKLPDAEAQSAARQLTARLIEDHAGAAILWEENSALTGEHFDAVVSAEVLPYMYALRGDRELKRAPQGSPLVQKVWEVLQRGPRTVGELVREVGNELTEAAILRALHDLWVKLRVVPLLETYPSDTGARWELMHRHWPAEVRQGASMSQALALSALVSLYLHGAVAATVEEVEAVLGALASRSRVREVVHGLGASRQLKMLAVGRASAYALAGGAAETLHEAAEQRDSDALKAQRIEAAAQKAAMPVRRPASDDRPRSTDRPRSADRAPKPREFAPRQASGKFAPRGERPAASGGKREWKPRPATGEKREWKPREGDASSGPRKPWVKLEGFSAGAGRTADRGDFPARKPAGPRTGEKREWKPRPASGEKREWKPRAAGGDKPAWKSKAGAGASAGTRGPAKPWAKREFGASGAKPWKPRAAGDKPAWKPRADAKPGDAATGERRPWQNRPTAGAASPAGEKRGFKPRSAAGEKREWKPRAGAAAGARKPWVKRDRGAPPTGAGRSFERGGFKKTFAKAPFRKAAPDGAAGADAAAGARPAFRKPSGFAGKSGGFAGKSGGFARKPGGFAPRTGGRPTGKPGAGAAGKSFGGKSFGKKPGGAGGKTFGAGKPFGKFGAKAGGRAGGGTPAWKKKSSGPGKSSGKGEKDAS